MKHCGECQLGKAMKIWCASECMAYEALDAQGYPYMRAPLTLGELPSDTHLSHVNDFVGNALLSIGLTVSGDNYGYGTPLFRATGMTFNEAKKHPESKLLLTLICDLPIRFIS